MQRSRLVVRAAGKETLDGPDTLQPQHFGIGRGERPVVIGMGAQDQHGGTSVQVDWSFIAFMGWIFPIWVSRMQKNLDFGDAGA